MNDTELSPIVRPSRVVVGVTGSASSAAALRRAVFEARRSGSVLVPLLAWEPPGGEAVYRMNPEPVLAELWEHQAGERLESAILAALGALPADVHIEPTVVRAPAVLALNALADQPTDLLVLGAGSRRPLARFFHGRVRFRTVAHAQAPVLLVAPPTPPALPRSVRRELRRVTPEDFLRPADRGRSAH